MVRLLSVKSIFFGQESVMSHLLDVNVDTEIKDKGEAIPSGQQREKQIVTD